MIVELPFPPAGLNPNKRLHWAAKAKAVKAYRDACRTLTWQACVKGAPQFGQSIKVTITFIVPDRRWRDDDNIIGSFKAGRDGLADALGVNDRRFVTTYEINRDPVKGGRVRVDICDQELKRQNEV